MINDNPKLSFTILKTNKHTTPSSCNNLRDKGNVRKNRLIQSMVITLERGEGG